MIVDAASLCISRDVIDSGKLLAKGSVLSWSYLVVGCSLCR
jgi:hypothetical protein